MHVESLRFLLLSGTGILSVIGIIARLAYRKFKRSGAQEVETFASYITQGSKYYIGRFIRRRLAAELTLRQYARLNLKVSAREMLVPATYPVHLKVDEVFVPLLLRGGLQDQINHTDLLERSGERIIILGEPGSGKSSLFKRLFRDACRRAASLPRSSPLPILFELRNLSKLAESKKSITHENLFGMLMASLEHSAVYRASHAVDDLSHGAGFLILLDGLDEVSSAIAPTVVDALVRFSAFLAEKAPESTLLVSSRTQYYFSLQPRQLEEVFEIFTVRPFSLGDIYQFLINWPFESSPRANITRIFSRLRQLPSLTEMCTNPLALSMFVARDQQTGGAELPETRSRFYGSLIDELIVNRRSRAEQLPAGRQRLRDARRQILGSVSLEHLLSSEETQNSLPAPRFVEAIAKARYGTSDPMATLDELANETGLFTWERKGETMRFLHLTLCEFLAAAEVVERGDEGWQLLLNVLHSGADLTSNPGSDFWGARLSEVVAFAAGLAPRSLRERILQDLFNAGRTRLLLKAIVEAQAYDLSIASTIIENECNEVFSYAPEYWDTEWLLRLRTIITVLRDATSSGRKELTTRSARLPDSSQLLMKLIVEYSAEDKLLSTLARQDAESAISIAEKTGRRELMDHVAAAADDFAVLQGILGRCDRGVDIWRFALIECAFVNRSVAHLLASLANESSESYARNPKMRWERSINIGGSAYATLLDRVLLERNAWSEASRPFLARLSQVQPPYSLLLAAMKETALRLLATALLPGAAAIAVAIYALTHLNGLVFNSLLPAAAGSGGVLAAFLRLVIPFIKSRAQDRNDRQQDNSVEIDGMQVDIDLKSKAGHSYNRSGSQLDGSVRQLYRGWVLLEILNIGEFHFRGVDDVLEPHQAVPIRTRLIAVSRGVSMADLRALWAARKLRRVQPHAKSIPKTKSV